MTYQSEKVYEWLCENKNKGIHFINKEQEKITLLVDDILSTIEMINNEKGIECESLFYRKKNLSDFFALKNEREEES